MWYVIKTYRVGDKVVNEVVFDVNKALEEEAEMADEKKKKKKKKEAEEEDVNMANFLGQIQKSKDATENIGLDKNAKQKGKIIPDDEGKKGKGKGKNKGGQQAEPQQSKKDKKKAGKKGGKKNDEEEEDEEEEMVEEKENGEKDEDEV